MAYIVEKDSFGYIISDGDLENAIFTTCYAAIGYGRPELLTPIINMVKTLPRDKWYRHPEHAAKSPESLARYGYISRDQLIFLVAACKYFGYQDVIQTINKELPLFCDIGGKWICTLEFKHFLQMASGVKGFPCFRFPWLPVMGLVYLPFKLQYFNYHLYAWMIWCLPSGAVKSACWLVFNLMCRVWGVNKMPWYPTQENLLYRVLQGKKVPWDEVYRCTPYCGIVWEKGPEKPHWFNPVELSENSLFLDKQIVTRLNSDLS